MRTIKILLWIVIAVLFTSCETSLTNVVDSCGEGDFISSKTNSKILFISRRIENSADWNIFLMNFDGSQQVKITDLTVRCEKVVISHSGQTILFVHNSQDFFYELYSINIDGTKLTLIDRANRYLGSADWTLDDKKIIYSKNRNESTDDNDLILYDFITKEKVTLTDSGNNYSAKFSPDNKIVYSQENNMSSGIYLMNIDGSNKQLTKTYHANWDTGFPNFGNYNPKWSLDGKKIVY